MNDLDRLAKAEAEATRRSRLLSLAARKLGIAETAAAYYRSKLDGRARRPIRERVAALLSSIAQSKADAAEAEREILAAEATDWNAMSSPTAKSARSLADLRHNPE